MKSVRLFGVLVTMLVFSTGAWGATLAAGDVKGFVGAMQELKPYFDQYADEVGDDGEGSGAAQVMGDWARSLRDQQEVEGTLRKHGFDFERWAVVSEQVTQAYLAIKFGAEGEDVLGQMRQSIAEIENSKDIPAESKAQMLEQMRQSMEEMEKSFAASPEDQAALKPFLAQLDAIFEWQQ